jgi:hypothetical protein
VSRPRTAIALALALLALTFAACGDDDEEPTITTAPSAESEAPSGGAVHPSAGALPPELVECFADRGFEVGSPTEIHSAPPEVVQKCFGRLHQGGGGVP